MYHNDLFSSQRGYFQIRGSGGGGGLGPHIKFGGKIWGKVRPSSPNKRKNLGSSVTTRRKSWRKVPILGSYLKFRGQNLGYLSLIFLEAKFWAPTIISEANFGAKPQPPDLLIWKYPLGFAYWCDKKLYAHRHMYRVFPISHDIPRNR